jgi:hypothetical protein
LRLVAGGWFVLREKYCWLVADKPSEQAESTLITKRQKLRRLLPSSNLYMANKYLQLQVKMVVF